MSDKIIIGLDVDSTINNFHELIVDKFKKITGEVDFSINDILYWNLSKVVSNLYKDKYPLDIFDNIYLNEEFTYELDLLDGVIEVLEEAIKRDDIEVVIVTAINKELITVRDKWFKDKVGLDLKVFYEVDKKNVTMNYLIDDALHNLDALSNIIGSENCICIAQKYNEDTSYTRVNHIKEAFNYIYKKENLL